MGFAALWSIIGRVERWDELLAISY
jgi:hypothetical protein